MKRRATTTIAAGALAREIGDPEILANADVNLTLNHLALGDVPRALAFLEPIEAALASPGGWNTWRLPAPHSSPPRARSAMLPCGTPARHDPVKLIIDQNLPLWWQ